MIAQRQFLVHGTRGMGTWRRSQSVFGSSVWCPAFRLPGGKSTLKRGHQTPAASVRRVLI